MKYFLYCRKSSEDQHRQVLSIESQRREALHRFGSAGDIEIAEVFVEEKSAMRPGRPVFGEMISHIERGDAAGIIAWAPDRLARNSIDGGQIIYLLDQRILCDLKFLTYTFENNSQGKFMLQIMFGQSKYYSDALGENVRRGNRTKVELGWRPNQAPLGYLNEPAAKTIIPDPERFATMRRMWELMMTGAYSPDQIRHIATAEWGFRTRPTKRWPGGPIQHSTMYRLFTNPFYAGWIVWAGTWYRGKHEAMITQQEFDLVQAILGRKTKSHTRPKRFTFGGLIRCGACGRLVTAETKINRFGTKYAYYHCAGRSSANCPERSITVEALEAQIAAALKQLEIPAPLQERLLTKISEIDHEHQERNRHREAVLQIRLKELKQKRSNLIDMRLQGVLSEEEFTEKLNGIKREDRTLDEAMAVAPIEADGLIEPLKVLFRLGNCCSELFLAADDAIKRELFVLVFSNPTLAGKNVRFQAAEPFSLIPKTADLSMMLAFIDAIGKMLGTSAFVTAIARMTTLAEQAATKAQIDDLRSAA